MTTMEDMLKGRSVVRCECGKEVVVAQVRTEDFRAIAHFLPCACGSLAPISIEPGSILGGLHPAVMHVWGPAKS